MMYELLDESNFLLFCAKHYDNPHCYNTEEFNDDLKRIKYIKKLVTRYIEHGDLKERLILNHLIILQNVFGPVALCKIIFLKMSDQLSYVKPFLVLLNILPKVVYNVGGMNVVIKTDEIEMDLGVVKALRNI